ncbi:MAG: indole-3-glycerol phosphate synthase TrpC [Chloroflexia bacterium]
MSPGRVKLSPGGAGLPARAVGRRGGSPLAALYADFGAAAISVLTDARYFGGSLNDLVAVRSEVGLPVLRKDFILNEYQVLESRAWGADAVLLIVSALDQDDLADLLEYARVLGMDALVEVHDATELEAALEVGAPIIGVNNRNLRTLKVDLQTTVDLAPLVPSGHFLVSESGVSGWADVEMLGAVGVGAVLVGEALMRAADPAAKLRELVGE